MNTAPAHSILFAKDDPMPGLTSSLLASTDVLSQMEDADVKLYAGADTQLMEYTKEQSIT
jgi:hypothetical protein